MTQLTEQRRAELIDTYRRGLLEDVVPFWQRCGVDADHGGFLTCLNRDGAVVDTDKGVWQQGRASWLFGELFNNVEQRDDWLDLARNGVEFMERHCFDQTDGRMWFQVTKEGQPIRKRRYAFSESFAAIAYGELAQATGSDEFAEKARCCFQRFIDHNLAPKGVEPKFTNVRPTRGIGFPMITINTAQELRRSIQLDIANEWIDRSIDNIVNYHIKEDIQCVMETVGPQGEILDHFDGRTLNPGHAIEGAWFILAEGKERSDDGLIQLGCRMLDWMWKRGWDNEHGGMLYFSDVYDLPVQEYWHDMKFWWPQNETIIATLLAWSLTGDEKYAKWHTAIHDWSYEHFPDTEYGEWFGYLHRDGRLSSPLKGNLWKGPFHLPRMLLTCWEILKPETP